MMARVGVLPSLCVIIAAVAIGWAVLREQALEVAHAKARVAPLSSSSVEPSASESEGAVRRLSDALRIKTVGNWSAENHVTHEEPFLAFHSFLAAAYPLTWSALRVHKVNTHSLILHWEGKDEALPPAILLSHFDVVPVDPLDEADWTHSPFDGVVAEGYIWGRGALDTKISLLAIMEAVEVLLKEGFQPQRTFILAFGHDEEVGGTYGAMEIARQLRKSGVSKAAFVLDEGGALMVEGFRPFTRKPVAVIGTAEKGMANIEMEVTTKGGHSSMPPLDGSAVGSIVGRVLSRLDKSPINPSMRAPTSDLLEALSPEVPLPLRPLLRHVRRPMIGTLVAQVLGAASPEAAGMTRTTVAATEVHAGVARNVLPQQAIVNFNARVMPGETRQDVLHYINVTGVAKDAPYVRLSLTGHGQEPSGVSDCRGATYTRLSQAILETLQDEEKGLLTAPYLVMGGTDSRHYAELTSEIFRFSPIFLNKTAGDLARIHGNDERVAIVNYLKAILFYKRFIVLGQAPL